MRFGRDAMRLLRARLGRHGHCAQALYAVLQGDIEGGSSNNIPSSISRHGHYAQALYAVLQGDTEGRSSNNILLSINFKGALQLLINRHG